MSTTDRKSGARRRRPAEDRLFGKHGLDPAVLRPAGRVPGGIVVPLPSDTEVGWLRNVVAAQVSPAYAQAWCRFGTAHCLKLTLSEQKGK